MMKCQCKPIRERVCFCSHPEQKNMTFWPRDAVWYYSLVDIFLSMPMSPLWHFLSPNILDFSFVAFHFILLDNSAYQCEQRLLTTAGARRPRCCTKADATSSQHRIILYSRQHASQSHSTSTLIGIMTWVHEWFIFNATDLLEPEFSPPITASLLDSKISVEGLTFFWQ